MLVSYAGSVDNQLISPLPSLCPDRPMTVKDDGMSMPAWATDPQRFLQQLEQV